MRIGIISGVLRLTVSLTRHARSPVNQEFTFCLMSL